MKFQVMKVVQFLPYFPPHTGGLENVAEKLAKYMLKYAGAEMLVITSDIGQEKKGYFEYKKDGYKIICVPSFNIIDHFPCYRFWTKGFKKAMNKIKNYDPDIIHTHTRFFLQTFYGGIRARLHHKKRVHTEHGSGFVTGISWGKKIMARIYDQVFGRLVFSCADKIISINYINLQFIKKFTKLSKCSVIYNGIEDYNIQKNDNKTDTVRIAYIGRLSPLKGINVLLYAVHLLQTEGRFDFNLDIIGDGEEFNKIKKYIDDNKLKNIHLWGKKSHDDIIQKVLPNTDIVVNPSYQEGLPTTALEGLIGKCVVVATNVGGTSEISKAGDLILVKPGDGKDLKKGLEFAIQNYRTLSGKSYEGLKKKFSRKNNIRQCFDLYTSLIKQH